MIGIITFIKVLMESLLIYFQFLFIIPRSVEKSIEKLQHDFLCKEWKNSSGNHLVDWKVVCRSKDKVGIDLWSIGLVNKSLLCKWLQRFGEKDGIFIAKNHSYQVCVSQ